VSARRALFRALFSAIVVIVDLNDLETSMVSFEHIAQRLAPSASVPSIGGSKAATLEQALQRVARAERELHDARAEARRLGRAAGKKLNTLFEDSTFVRRSSSESWLEETRSEAYTAGFEKACYFFERALRPQSEKERDPFYRIAAGMVRKGRQGLDLTDKPVSEIDAIQARIRKDREVDLSSNAALGAATTPDALANQILEAGKRARSATDRDPEPEMNALSRAIVKSGRKRRGADK
jgi:hypothetical protein